MKKNTTKGVIGLMALIAVSPIFTQPTHSTELQKPPAMSTDEKKMVGQRPGNNPEWTWMTADHATHLLKGVGYSVVHPLQKNKAHWQGIIATNNGQTTGFVNINRHGEVSTFMSSDILQRWPMFSSEEVLAFKDREDLVKQIHNKYGISTALAAREVEIFFLGDNITLINY